MKLISKREQWRLTHALLLALCYTRSDSTISDEDKKKSTNLLLDELKSINNFRSEEELQIFLVAYFSSKVSKEDKNGD